MCTYSCIADSTQACGGAGTYISIYYDQTKYTPDAGAIPLSGSATGPITTPTGTSTGITSVATSRPSPTGGPVIVPSVGAYFYVGCYSEATTGRALTSKSYANDSMTIESCASFCMGYTWWGVEYARECKSFNRLVIITDIHHFLK
jgi:iron transport multicopper oxidase